MKEEDLSLAEGTGLEPARAESPLAFQASALPFGASLHKIKHRCQTSHTLQLFFFFGKLFPLIIIKMIHIIIIFINIFWIRRSYFFHKSSYFWNSIQINPSIFSPWINSITEKYFSNISYYRERILCKTPA